MLTHSLPRNGEDALGHILDIGGCDSSHRNPTVVGEVNVRVFAYLEHLVSRPYADNRSARSVRDAFHRREAEKCIWCNLFPCSEGFLGHPCHEIVLSSSS